MKTCTNYRFIERDFWMQKVKDNSPVLSPAQIEQMLETCGQSWSDLTFKFYSDGSVVVRDNESGQTVSPKELYGAALDYYIRKRMDLIRIHLQEKCLTEIQENARLQLKYA